MRIRRMQLTDLDQVMALERQAYGFPWTEQVFRDCLRVGYECWVVEAGGLDVAGYAVLSVGAGECHLLNLCVAPAVRRVGVGRAFLMAMLGKGRAGGALHAFLEVRPSNTGAIALYRTAGFERIGLRRGYYQAEGGREDALVFRRPLDDLAA